MPYHHSFDYTLSVLIDAPVHAQVANQVWVLFWGKLALPGVVPQALDKIRASKDCMEKACR